MFFHLGKLNRFGLTDKGVDMKPGAGVTNGLATDAGRRGLLAGVVLLVFVVLLAPSAHAAEEQKKEESKQETQAQDFSLGEVAVTATRKEKLLSDVPDVLQVITREEIEEINPRSTGELLEYVSGVTVETGTGSGYPKRSVIGLNGLPPQYTLVLVDGVRLLSEHIHTGQNVEQIPPEAIERIEVMRGAAAAQYGSDAIGGVVNIITRKAGDKSEKSVKVSGGSYDTYTGSFSIFEPITDRLKLSLIASREQSDGIPLEAPTHRLDNMGYEKLNLLSRLEYKLSQSSDVYGWVLGADNTMDWFNDETDSDLETAVVGMRNSITPRIDLHSEVAFSNWSAETGGEEHELLEPESFVTWDVTDYHTLTAGVDFLHREFERSAVENAPDQDTFGLFLQDEWDVTERLIVMSALRYDKVEEVEGVVSPKISALYSFDAPVRLRGSVSRGFSAPTPQELYEKGSGHGGLAYRFGNPDLDPEYSTTYGLGADFFSGSPFELMVYNFYSKIDDLVVPVYEGPWAGHEPLQVWRRQNIDEARVYGSEIKARYTFSPNFRLEGGATFTDNEDEDTGRQLPFDPGWSPFVKAVANRRLSETWTTSGFVALDGAYNRSAWSWKPAPGAPTADPSGLTTKLDDYENLKAGVSFDYKNSWEFFFKVYNILGQDFEHLDDVHTIIDGEPYFEVGARLSW